MCILPCLVFLVPFLPALSILLPTHTRGSPFQRGNRKCRLLDKETFRRRRRVWAGWKAGS